MSEIVSSRASHQDYTSSVYIATSLHGVYIRRHCDVLAGVLVTYSCPEKTDLRLWPLTNECEIGPVIPARIDVAVDGWSPIMAKLLWKTNTINGFVISMTWPDSGVMADSELVLGFETAEQAAEYRTALTNTIIGSGPHSFPGLDPAPAGSRPRSTDVSRDTEDSQESGSSYTDQSVLDRLGDWKAIKELKGLTVYYQEDKTGGAYMISTRIRASPQTVMEALSTGSFLKSCGDVSLLRREGDVEIVHLKLNPVGLGQWFLTHREMLVERIRTEYDCGTLGVLFKTCDNVFTTNKYSLLTWLWDPVEAKIPAAGFSISPVETLGRVRESLVALVLKIDFGGCCSATHPLRPIIDALGVCEYWVDQVLSTVPDLKTTLENKQMYSTSSSVLTRMASLRSQNKSFRSSFHGDVRDSNLVSQTGLISTGVLNPKFWSNPGAAGFLVRGPNYLTDKIKMPASEPRFKLDWVYILKYKEPTPNVARFLPALRSGTNDFTFVTHIMLPGPPYMSLTIGWTTNADKWTPSSSSVDSDNESSDPFDLSLTRFLAAEESVRHGIFKLIPKVVEGGWVIKKAVGHTPVIMGRKLKQYYHTGEGYFEIDIDVASSAAASAIIGIVRNATRTVLVDIAVLLEGGRPDELPETLLGTVRLDHVDMDAAVSLDSIISQN